MKNPLQRNSGLKKIDFFSRKMEAIKKGGHNRPPFHISGQGLNLFFDKSNNLIYTIVIDVDEVDTCF